MFTELGIGREHLENRGQPVDDTTMPRDEFGDGRPILDDVDRLAVFHGIEQRVEVLCHVVGGH
jgi:hypothetical protein